jgi:hypothetical protein
MSFDIFFGIFEGGEKSNIPRERITRVLAPYPISHESDLLRVSFPDGETADFYVDSENQIDGFSVNRPPVSPAFWDLIFDLLKIRGAVLYWPSGAAVADSSTAAELPRNMVDALGTPITVGSPQELVVCIEAS